MKRSSGPRKTANLSQSVHQRLNMYAISATTAGVSLLALAQPSEAKIVYTSAHAKLPINAHFYLDLNHDGVKDFGFYLRSASSPPTGSRSFYNSLRVTGQQKNEVWAIRSSSRLCAAALPNGKQVGPKAPFQKGSFLMFAFAQSVGGGAGSLCPWGYGVSAQYLGLKFLIKGKIHFGWARLGSFQFFPKPAATLTGYAYETIPNKRIATGRTKGPDDASIEEPNEALTMPTPDHATLGALAMGSPGLSIWRRKESALQGN